MVTSPNLLILHLEAKQGGVDLVFSAAVNRQCFTGKVSETLQTSRF